MGNAVAAIDDSASKRAVRDFGRCPGGGEGKDGLDGDVEAGAVERFKHDFSSVLAVFWGIEGLAKLVSESRGVI